MWIPSHRRSCDSRFLLTQKLNQRTEMSAVFFRFIVRFNIGKEIPGSISRWGTKIPLILKGLRHEPGLFFPFPINVGLCKLQMVSADSTCRAWKVAKTKHADDPTLGEVLRERRRAQRMVISCFESLLSFWTHPLKFVTKSYFLLLVFFGSEGKSSIFRRF